MRPREGSNLEVDVHRPARVPTGVDGLEANRTLGVGHLISAEIFLANSVLGAHIGIDAQRVTVPDVYLGAPQRQARGAVHAGDIENQAQRNTRARGAAR